MSSSAAQKAWYERNRERILEERKRKYREDPHTKRAETKKWSESNPDKVKDRYYRRVFGVGLADVERMESEQNGLCLICGHPETSQEKGKAVRRLAVDHNHSTGTVRGLLCARCNQVIGKVDEDIELLYKMIGYLEFHSKEKVS